jgi:hypothetical protein
MGGRTTERDVQRIFTREVQDGDNRVFVIVRRGMKGLAFSSALNRCAVYPEFPAHDEDRYDQCVWGELHANVLSLLPANFHTELVDEVEIDIVTKEEEEQKLRVAEIKRLVRA